ncbi:hypothetical protein HN011_011773 [Eciton burchellii]|jgi:hypothetical protein|nr:hypothetical protein HN011_011773 [Eciton burchellii]
MSVEISGSYRVLQSSFVILIVVLDGLWAWHFALQEKPLPLVSQEDYCVALLPSTSKDAHSLCSRSNVSRPTVKRPWIVSEFDQLKTCFILRISRSLLVYFS